CDLSSRPAAWDHVQVRVTGIATHEFESFLLDDPSCRVDEASTSVWLTYGGRLSSETVFCCPGEPRRSLRTNSLVVEGVRPPAAEDLVFRRFRQLLRTQARSTVRVTVVGTFFAGEKNPDSNRWGGFGHTGCCS